jgi:putative ABC transport system permease protein
MNVFDSLYIAIKALGRNKLRTGLTMLGMIIGVAAVMTMVALGSGAQASVQDEMRSAGTNLIYVTAGNYTRGGDDIKIASGLGAAKTLMAADADAIGRQISGIKYWSPGVGDRAPLTAGDRRYFGRVIGANQDFGAMHSWTLRRGAMFSRADVDGKARVAVLGTAVSGALFGDGADPTGRSIAIRNERFTVVGLTESKIEDQPESVFVPFTTLQDMRGVTYLDTITVAAIEAGDASRIAAEIGTVLRQRHHLGDGTGAAIAGVPEDFLVKTEASKALTKGLYTSAAVFVLANLPQLDQITTEEMAGTLQQTGKTLTALLASIAAISLIVGGIGIMNIMLVSVTERTREIGLRMAMGARGKDVLVQFLVEAITLSAVGGALGVGLGLIASSVVTSVLEWQTVVSAAAIAMAVGTALATGVFFGFYPARRASQLDPIDALRYE